MDKSGKKWLFCLLHLVKIGVFIGKYDPVPRSLIKICLKCEGHVSLLTAADRMSKTIESHYFTSIDWTYWHFRFAVASVSMMKHWNSQTNCPQWRMYYCMSFLPSGYLITEAELGWTAWNTSELVELCWLRNWQHFLGASLILPRIGCYREMYVALLFKNLRSSLETSHAYFMYKNTHCQDWPLPSLELFAGSGWLHHLNVYQFVCGWHLFFPSVEYSNIQAPAKSISDKEPWGPFRNRNWLWLLFAVFFGGWNTKVRCRYFTPTFMHKQWYVKVNMCVFPAVVEKILSIPYFAWSLHNKTKYWADIESKKCELYKKWICKKSEGT